VIKLKVVNTKRFENEEVIMLAYRYLFWACMRGNIYVVNYILKEYGISPFMAEKSEGQTPFLIAIQSNQEKVVRLLLAKKFTYAADPNLIKKQMNASEKFGNNPLHKACRFRNHRLIKLLLEANIGAIDKRNMFGRLPLEMPHNDIMNDLKVRKVFNKHLRTHGHLK
jgi:ankyrin repeat protein